MKSFLSLLTIFCFLMNIKAQQYFEGEIKYNAIMFNNNKIDTWSIEVDYGKGIFYANLKTENNLIKEEEKEILVDVIQNKEYQINKVKKTYSFKNSNAYNDFTFEKTGEQKMYFGKMIYKYILSKNAQTTLYGWYSNDYIMNCKGNKITVNGSAPFVLNEHIALIIESYRNEQKEFALYATDIQPKQYEDAYFSLVGYTNGKRKIEIINDGAEDILQPPPPAEVAEPARKVEEEDENTFIKVEIEPTFKSNFENYLAINLKYPIDVPNKPNCNCIVQFTVNTNGTIGLPVNNINCTVADNRFTSAARKFITNTNGKWNAAIQNGVKVNALHTVVLKFKYKK